MIRDRLKRAARRLLKRGRPEPSAPRPAAPASSAPARDLDLDLDEHEDEAVDLEVDSALLADWVGEGRQVHFLDIRELTEMRAGHVEHAHLMPMGQVPDRQGELPGDRSVVVYCAAGARSFQIAHYLRDQGHADVWSMVGGMGSWLAQGGRQIIPPAAPLGPGERARLGEAAAERLGVAARAGFVQEVRQTDEGVRFTLGVVGDSGEFERQAGLVADDLEPI